jgi:hypothetical protein
MKALIFWHTVMTLNAAYICYQQELNDFAYKLAQFTLFVFAITLLVIFRVITGKRVMY